MDDQPAQDIRRHRHGDRPPEDAAEAAAGRDHGLLPVVRRVEPHRRGDRHRHRRHHAGTRGRLDLLHLHGPRLRGLPLRGHQPSHRQGLQAAARERRRHALLQVPGGPRRRRGHRRRHDLGLTTHRHSIRRRPTG